jgi:hypothetical protein
MPYEHLLPEPLRGSNERIDDRMPQAAPSRRARGRGERRRKRTNEDEPAQHRRKIRLTSLRYNPADPASVPHMQTYELEQRRA